MLSPHTAWGLVSSRTRSPISGGACLSCSSPVQARRFEADHGRQVPHRCLERLVGPRNRAGATKIPYLFAAVFSRNLHLPADPLECRPEDSSAHVVPARAWRVLAVLKTMTGEYAGRTAVAVPVYDASWIYPQRLCFHCLCGAHFTRNDRCGCGTLGKQSNAPVHLAFAAHPEEPWV